MTFADLIEHVPCLIVEGSGYWQARPGREVLARGGVAWPARKEAPRSAAYPCSRERFLSLGTATDAYKHGCADSLRSALLKRLDIITEFAGHCGRHHRRWLVGTATTRIRRWSSDALTGRPQRHAGDDPTSPTTVRRRIKSTVDACGAALVAIHHTRKMGAEDWLDTHQLWSRRTPTSSSC
jgi:hypothetical protein